ncbi:MAG: dTDP-4-dehydrorhamnose reductase [Clostridia bacterium]|nr:dTDP-4-dehydrorhamnose reductase [Clostridia bacterium]
MIIVTGAKGQLGGDVCRELKNRGLAFLGIDREELDITDEKAVKIFFEENKATALIHCAAYVAVDKAEDEKELCFLINETGTENLARECRRYGIKMLYVSTDYVFDGKGEAPFLPDDKKGPLGVYGQSKLMGEEAVRANLEKYFIVRTSWVFGERNTNFIATMLRLAETRNEISVVSDQVGSPTYAKDLAVLLCDIIVTDCYGTYHGTNEGFCSWYDLAKKTFEAANKKITVNPVTSEQYPTKATRPKNSRLSKECLTENGFARLPLWEDAVERYLNNIL